MCVYSRTTHCQNMKKTMKMRKSRSHKRKSQKGGIFGYYDFYVPAEDNERFQKILNARPVYVREQLKTAWDKVKNYPVKRKESLDKWDPPRTIQVISPEDQAVRRNERLAEMVRDKEKVDNLYNQAIILLDSEDYTYTNKEAIRTHLLYGKETSNINILLTILNDIKQGIETLKKIKRDQNQSQSQNQNQSQNMQEIAKNILTNPRMVSRVGSTPGRPTIRISSLQTSPYLQRRQGGSRKRKRTKRTNKGRRSRKHEK